MEKKAPDCIIDGQRLLLRTIRLSDVGERYVKWMNDADVTQFTESRFNQQTRESIAEFVKSVSENPAYVFLAIILKDRGEHIGNIKIGPIDRNHQFADIGIIIGEKQFWGKGYATEAIRLVVEYSFGKLNLHKLTAGAYHVNEGSCRAFTKAGFQVEGTLKAQYLYKGTFVDKICLGLINKLYQTVPEAARGHTVR